MSRHDPAIILSRARYGFAAAIGVMGLATFLVASPLTAVPADAARARVTLAAADIPGAVDLGAASSFSVLGSSSVTTTGNTIIGGEVGVSPGTSVVGFPPGIIKANSGGYHSADTSAANAQLAAQSAYTDAKGRTPTAQYPAADDIGARSFGPGTYQFPTSIGITGTVTLDGGGNPQSVFIFQAGSTLIAEPYSKVILTNGAQATNVFWQVGSSATLKTGSTFAGTVVAQASVTVESNVSVEGRTIALAGAVTLESDTFETAPASSPAPGNQSLPQTSEESNSLTTPPSAAVPPGYRHANRLVPWRGLAVDPPGGDPSAQPPGETLLPKTGGTIVVAAWSVWLLILGSMLVSWAGRRRRPREEGSGLRLRSGGRP